MDHPNYTTEHRKCQHLTNEERHEIEVRLKDGWSVYKIAKHLDRPYNTIKKEIERGTVSLYNGKRKVYKADVGKAVYLEHRKNSRKQYRRLAVARFITYVIVHFFGDDKWSLDACVGHALQSGEFRRDEIVCTKTLYNYVDLGLLAIKNHNLPEKLQRNTKSKTVRENRKNLGKSIEERPEIVALREEFGHWELDSVIGQKRKGEPVVITLTERKTRMCLWLKVRDHSAEAVMEALRELFAGFGDLWKEVFKTITTDNGSEFALLSEFEADGLGIYFTHPYTSCEKGTNECHNRMLRRFIPKGKSIADYTADDICFFADCINGLPRKLLAYHTPEELFEAQLDRIYAA